MKRLTALLIVFMLVFPAFAWAAGGTKQSSEGTAPIEETGVTGETSSYAVHIFNYVVVVVPGSDETKTTVGLFTADSSGTANELISTYTLGGKLGQAVSNVAQTVSPGPEHGKVVSTFVHQAVQARKQEKEQVKTEKEAEKRERKEVKETEKEKKRLEKEERKRIRNGDGGEEDD